MHKCGVGRVVTCEGVLLKSMYHMSERIYYRNLWETGGLVGSLSEAVRQGEV